MHDMSTDEWMAFCREGTRTGKLATTRADGSPHCTPIWFVVDDDGTFLFNTGRDSVKGRSLARDARAVIVVDDEHPPYSFVMVRGEAELSEDLDAMLPWSTAIGGRYMGAERADDFGRRNAVEGELLVRVRPTHVVAQAGVSDEQD
jgi:PPOX class probable F420-dependent enzyme